MHRWLLSFMLICFPMISQAKPQSSGPDIVRTAASSGKFSTLLNALIATELLETLQNQPGPFTVFAPPDQAFKNLGEETIASLLKPENREQLKSILTYHVVAGRLTAADLHKNPVQTTLNGAKIRFKVTGHTAFINDSRIIAKDLECKNGIIHVIDSVLMIPKSSNTIVDVARDAKTFKTLLDALTAAELKQVFEGDDKFTVFAPTDEAFAKLPRGTLTSLLKPENKSKLVAILKYHVVSGEVTAKDAIIAGQAKTLQGSKVKASIKNGRLNINDSSVIASDVKASNGIIHVIDRVLLPE